MTASSSTLPLVQRTLRNFPFQQACWTSFTLASIEKLGDGLNEKPLIRKEAHLLAMRLLFVITPCIATLEAIQSVITLLPTTLIRYGLSENRESIKHMEHVTQLVMIAVSMTLLLPIHVFNPLQLASPSAAHAVSKRQENSADSREEKQSPRWIEGSFEGKVGAEFWTRRSMLAIASLNARLASSTFLKRELDLVAMRVMMLMLPVIALLEAVGQIGGILPKNFINYCKGKAFTVESDLRSVFQLFSTAVKSALSFPIAVFNPDSFFPSKPFARHQQDSDSVTKPSLNHVEADRLHDEKDKKEASPLRQMALVVSDNNTRSSDHQSLLNVSQRRASGSLEQSPLTILQMIDHRLMTEALKRFVEALQKTNLTAEQGNNQVSKRSEKLPPIPQEGLILKVSVKALRGFLKENTTGPLSGVFARRSTFTDDSFYTFFVSPAWFAIIRDAMGYDSVLDTFVRDQCTFSKPSKSLNMPVYSKENLSQLIAELTVLKAKQTPSDFLTIALEVALDVLRKMESKTYPIDQVLVLEFFGQFAALFEKGETPIALSLTSDLETSLVTHDGMLEMGSEDFTDQHLADYLPQLARAAPHLKGIRLKAGSKLTSEGVLEALEKFDVKRCRWRTIELVGFQGLDFSRLERALENQFPYVRELNLESCSSIPVDALESLRKKFRIKIDRNDEHLKPLDTAFMDQLVAIAAKSTRVIGQEFAALFKRGEQTGEAPVPKIERLAASALRSFSAFNRLKINDSFFTHRLLPAINNYFPSLRHLELNGYLLTNTAAKGLAMIRALVSFSVKELRLGPKIDPSFKSFFEGLNVLKWELFSIVGENKELSLEGAQEIAGWMKAGAACRGVKASYTISYVDERSAVKILGVLNSDETEAATALPRLATSAF